MTMRKAKRKNWIKRHEDGINLFFFIFSIACCLWIIYMMIFKFWFFTRPIFSFAGILLIFTEIGCAISWYGEIQDARKRKKKNH